MKNVLRLVRTTDEDDDTGNVFQIDQDGRTILSADEQTLYSFDRVFAEPTNESLYGHLIAPAIHTIKNTRTAVSHNFAVFLAGHRIKARDLLLDVPPPDDTHGMLANLPTADFTDPGLLARAAADFFSSRPSNMDLSVSCVTFGTAKGHGPYTSATDFVAAAMDEDSAVSVDDGALEATRISLDGPAALQQLLYALRQGTAPAKQKAAKATVWTMRVTKSGPLPAVHAIHFILLPSVRPTAPCPIQAVVAAVAERSPTAPFRSSLLTQFIKPFILGKHPATAIGVAGHHAAQAAAPLFLNLSRRWAPLPVTRKWPHPVPKAVVPSQPADMGTPPRDSWWARPAQELIQSALRDVPTDHNAADCDTTPASPYNRPDRTRPDPPQTDSTDSISTGAESGGSFIDEEEPEPYQGHISRLATTGYSAHPIVQPQPRQVRQAPQLHPNPPAARPDRTLGRLTQSSLGASSSQREVTKSARPQEVRPHTQSQPQLSPRGGARPAQGVSPSVFRRLQRQLQAANCETVVADTAARRATDRCRQLEQQVAALKEKEKALVGIVRRLEKRNVELERAAGGAG